MSFSENLSLALQNIWGSKMRSFLTMLGIIIGIAAVMVIVGLGNGMENYMTDMFKSIGTNICEVTLTGRDTSRTASVEEMYEVLSDNARYFDNMSPTVSMRGSIKVGTEELDYTSATGVGETYFEIKSYEIAEGRALHYMDMESRSRVCVIGSYVADEYYGGHGVGETIRINGAEFTIVGVMAQEDDEPARGMTDDVVYLPYSTAARLSGMGSISSYSFTVIDEDNVAIAKNALENSLYDIFRSEDAYMVISMTQLLSVMTDMLNVVITILAVIAGISLVVGGVGIMNIMLVSVTERTREIGIRKALGAKEGSIMVQFVIEAAVTACIGGIFGIIAGFGFSSLGTVIITSVLGFEMEVTPSLGSIALAVGASAAIGVAFGFLPARKAALLNPIDALRYE